ncbi:MAG: hypothetical protein EXR21_04555 [Flavobacteriaceae bacterium]|nr:hypothetical protein [Flavobacteriaceae bacterium]
MNKQNIALLSSYLFHPCLLVVGGVAAMAYLIPFTATGLSERMKLLSLIASALYYFMFPLSVVFVMKLTGKVSSLHLPTREERFLPFSLIALSFFYGWWQLKQMQLPEEFLLYTLGAAVTALLCFVGNFFLKISAHAAGCGAMLAFFVLLSIFSQGELRLFLSLVLFVCGIVISARQELSAHTKTEIALGFFAGIMGMFAAVVVFFDSGFWN